MKIWLNLTCVESYNLEYILRFGEAYLEYFEVIRKAIEKYDPFEIALINCKEHEPEIR